MHVFRSKTLGRWAVLMLLSLALVGAVAVVGAQGNGADVDGDGDVTPTDAVFVINRLNAAPTGDDAAADVNGDGVISALDVEIVIDLLGSDPLGFGTAFQEQNGLVVIEMESIGSFPDDWELGTPQNPIAPDVDDPEDATGDAFIVWNLDGRENTPGASGLLTYRVQINNTGTYRFKWRSQVGEGTTASDSNDSWLKIEADSFYGLRGSTQTIVCPKGYDPSENDCTGMEPNGGGGQGYFKIYSSRVVDWTFRTSTSDDDGHDVYARFDTPGVYEILVSGRSGGHVIDRMVMYNIDTYNGNGEDLSLPQSPAVVVSE